MKSSFFLFALVVSFVACSPSIEVAAYKKGLQEAKSKNTLLLVDFYSDTCGACKLLQNETFKDSRVEEQLAQFVLYRANVGSQHGGSLAREFEVDVVPTVVFLSGDGKEVHRFTGFIPPDDFLSEIETAKKNGGLYSSN